MSYSHGEGQRSPAASKDEVPRIVKYDSTKQDEWNAGVFAAAAIFRTSHLLMPEQTDRFEAVTHDLHELIQTRILDAEEVVLQDPEVDGRSARRGGAQHGGRDSGPRVGRFSIPRDFQMHGRFMHTPTPSRARERPTSSRKEHLSAVFESIAGVRRLRGAATSTTKGRHRPARQAHPVFALKQ